MTCTDRPMGLLRRHR